MIYLSSFSKTLAPAFRVAWMSAPPVIAAKLEVAKQAGDLCTGGFDQRVVHEACRRGLLERHIPELRAHYQQKRDTMVAAIEQYMSDQVTWTLPRGGFFLWVALSNQLRSRDVMPLAQSRGVIYVDGSAFFVDGTGHGVHAAVVFGAVAVADRGRRQAAGRGRDGRCGNFAGAAGRHAVSVCVRADTVMVNTAPLTSI